jgi:LacI family fructose operon transcriptional repressor
MAAVLVEHLHACGHRRVAGLFGAMSTTGLERRAGFERAAAALGLEAQAMAVPHSTGEAERAGRAAVRPRPPRCAGGQQRRHAAAHPARLRAQGLSVPGDIALAGFDNNDWMDFVGQGTCGAGGISVIEQPVEEIGRTATAMLLDRLDNPDAPTRKVVLAGKLVARG